MSIIIAAALAPIAAVIGAFITLKISKRNSSGAINTSDATDLWEEGGNIRKELREDLSTTKEALTAAVTAVNALNEELRLSRDKTEAALEESRLSRKETGELKTQITELTAQIADLHRTSLEALTQVKTNNTLTLGGMADNAESRRIMDVPRSDRTPHERDHLDSASDRLPDDLAADQTKDKETP